MRAELLNGGAYSRTAFAAINKTATGGGGGDNTEVDGAWVDRLHPSEGGLAMSAKLVITYRAVLDSEETLKFGVQVQDATALDGTGAADYGDAIAQTTVETAASGGETVEGTCEVDIPLAEANRFIRAQVTPNLSLAGTLEWSAAIHFFGDSRVPSTRAFASVSNT